MVVGQLKCIYERGLRNMIKFSKNKKLNGVLNTIYEDLKELGLDEVKHYFNEFKSEVDYNLAQYGNLLIYFYDVRELYKNNGYKSLDRMSDQKIWDIYRRQVGYIARQMIRGA